MFRLDSVSVATQSTLRFDRATLKKGRKLDDGSVVREAVLSRADVAMSYPWGEEQATEAALSSQAYLEGLRGLAVVAKHPKSVRVDISRPETYREVGVILNARWDSAERCVVIEIVIRDAEANKAVEAGQTGVSEGYAVPHLDTSSQPALQMVRVPNHVALTLDDPPRMPGANIRNDHNKTEVPKMELVQLLAMLAGFKIRADSAANFHSDIQALFDSKAELEEVKTRADSADKKVAELQPIVDAIGVADVKDIDAAISDRVAKVVKARVRADSLGVKIPEDVVSESGILAHIAKERFPKADLTRCDAATLVYALESAPTGSARKMELSDTGNSGADSTRNDSNNNSQF